MSFNYSPFWKATSFLESDLNIPLVKPYFPKEKTNRGTINRTWEFFDNDLCSKPPLPVKKNPKEWNYESTTT